MNQYFLGNWSSLLSENHSCDIFLVLAYWHSSIEVCHRIIQTLMELHCLFALTLVFEQPWICSCREKYSTCHMQENGRAVRGKSKNNSTVWTFHFSKFFTTLFTIQMNRVWLHLCKVLFHFFIGIVLKNCVIFIQSCYETKAEI